MPFRLNKQSPETGVGLDSYLIRGLSAGTTLGKGYCIYKLALPSTHGLITPRERSPVTCDLGNYPLLQAGQCYIHSNIFYKPFTPHTITLSLILLLHFPFWASFFHKWCT